MKKMLVLFEFSGTVSKAFREMGWEAWSLDLRPTEGNDRFHHQVKVIYNREPDTYRVLNTNIDNWIYKMNFDLMVAHPECTYTTLSGSRWYADTIERVIGVENFKYWDNYSYIKQRAIEHPVSVVSTQHRPPTQYIQPHWFGHGYTKKTGLWLTNLQPLTKTEFIPKSEIEMVTTTTGKTFSKWYWDTSSLKGIERKKARSRFPTGIAKAMAEQWTNPVQNTLDNFF